MYFYSQADTHPLYIYFLSVLCKHHMLLVASLLLPARRPAAELLQRTASLSHLICEAEDVCARPNCAGAGLLAGPAGDS